MAMLGVSATAKAEIDSRNQVKRQHELLEIMSDATYSVLQRPDTRRGPYVIADADLRRPPSKPNNR